MKMPSMLYGRASVVKSRARKKLAAVVRTCDFEHLDCGPMLETRDTGGLLLVEPEDRQSPGEHFHCYALTIAIMDMLEGPQMFAAMDAWMKWSLEEAWRFLGVMEQDSTNTLAKNSALLVPYVEAAVRFWPLLKSEGERFGPGVNRAEGAWYAMRNLKYCLANLGIPAHELRAEPPGGPADFLQRIAKPGTLP